MTQHEISDLVFHVIVACSVLHTVLPPWDFLNDFPSAQKVYKVVIYVVGYVALNGRSTVYRSISVGNGTTPTPPAPPTK
jgi:predicted membrane channel-forming protein YqfA (hemolysin III family)